MNTPKSSHCQLPEEFDSSDSWMVFDVQESLKMIQPGCKDAP